MYEWTSLDHVALSESYNSPGSSSPRFPYDFFHINSINLDRDGSLLISARNTWTVYDLNPATGQIDWQLGGKHSSFKGAASTRTAWQHDPRELPDGVDQHLRQRLLADRAPAVARDRALAEPADRDRHARQPAHAHARPGRRRARATRRLLANGDWFIGWGQEPFFSELSPSGQDLFDAHFPPHTQSYRSLRLPWSGVPEHVPALASRRRRADVYASWNGATGVASWRLLAGGYSSVRSLHAILTVARSRVRDCAEGARRHVGPYVAVQALDATGRVLASSAAIQAAGLP